MARDREIICKYYTYENGPCEKRGVLVRFRNECQTCAKYDAIRHGRPARPDVRKAKMERILRKEREY